MHIMVCGLRGFPNVQGGVETHCQELYPRIVSAHDAKVTVLVRKAYHTEGEHWNGVHFTGLWSPTQQSLEAIVHTFLCVLYAAFRRPDVLHIHTIGPAVVTPLGRLFGLNIVVTHHGPDYDREKWGKAARFILRLGERFGMRCSNARIAISQVIRDLIRKSHGKESALIPNGVSLPTLSEDTELIDQLKLEAGKYIILVSRFVPEKRHSDLIQAFRQAKLSPEWKLVFVGNADHPGEYEKGIMQSISGDERIVCTGFITGDQLNQIFTHAGMLVLPSSHEGLPIALLEGLSYGLPCLASDIPANLCVEMPAEQYFPLGNTAKLAAFLEHTHAIEPDQAKRQELREWVSENYDWNEIAAATYAVYRGLR